VGIVSAGLGPLQRSALREENVPGLASALIGLVSNLHKKEITTVNVPPGVAVDDLPGTPSADGKNAEGPQSHHHDGAGHHAPAARDGKANRKREDMLNPVLLS
jgi:hypothetical protein